ncbi:uncharacterized protein LOC132033614 [Lycium ferocissimum]|uniref:uncharacterized protein LOC132033614 n=1 Tax=Lycium ferocissimum TaxID=112874 RepID=UPI002814CBB3|nr:uncharacterized protein LOC132033614 [Lycium ferocissimum]
MVDKRKLQKRVFVSEDDISTLLQRYTPMTVLTLLQEVEQVKDVKIDWNELVRKTTTGITNVREYQMLWRHLAYRNGLLDDLDDDAQPLDDDSDLEYELEAFPPVSSEASAEAAACVKVLIASGAPCDTNMSNGNTVEAPLTINIPNGQTSGTAAENSLHGISAYGTKITVPVLVEKQPLPSVMASESSLDTSGPASGNFPPRRRRKPWSAAEDMELIAAVQKCGEGNWANILKADFKGDRTASQLSQRWAIIRKRHGNMVGNDSQLSEAQLAARHAMSLAFGDNLRAARPISTNGGPNSGGGPGISSRFTAADTASGGPQSKHQQDLVPSKPIIPKNSLPKPAIVNPDPFARAAAIAASSRIATSSSAAAMAASSRVATPSSAAPMAASSRIATPSSAAAMAASSRIATSSSAVASLQKAAQSKKVVHIMPGGTPAVKSSVPGSTNGLPSNVHFIRTGLVSRPPGPSNASQSVTQHLQGHSLRSASPAVQPKPTLALPSRTNASSETPSTLTSRAAGIQENQTVVRPNLRGEKAEVIRDASLANTPQQQVPKDRTFGSGNLLTEKVEGQTSVLGVSVKELAGESKASRIHVQEKLIPSQETLSNKNENTKIELAVKNTVRR